MASESLLELGARMDPVIGYPRPDVEHEVHTQLASLGGVTSWQYAATDVRTPAGWLVAVFVQVDVRASSRHVAFRRADEARRTMLALPYSDWPGGVVSRVDVLEGPFWLPDGGAPRYVARYEVRAHPRPARKDSA